MSTFSRAFPLEDIRIRSGSDGRTVEAYAAVFNSPAEIHDRDGHYLEQISPSGFNKAIADAAPSGSRTGWMRVGEIGHSSRSLVICGRANGRSFSALQISQ